MDATDFYANPGVHCTNTNRYCVLVSVIRYSLFRNFLDCKSCWLDLYTQLLALTVGPSPSRHPSSPETSKSSPPGIAQKPSSLCHTPTTGLSLVGCWKHRNIGCNWSPKVEKYFDFFSRWNDQWTDQGVQHGYWSYDHLGKWRHSTRQVKPQGFSSGFSVFFSNYLQFLQYARFSHSMQTYERGLLTSSGGRNVFFRISEDMELWDRGVLGTGA